MKTVSVRITPVSSYSVPPVPQWLVPMVSYLLASATAPDGFDGRLTCRFTKMIADGEQTIESEEERVFRALSPLRVVFRFISRYCDANMIQRNRSELIAGQGVISKIRPEHDSESLNAWRASSSRS
jgi:hypothetical protein